MRYAALIERTVELAGLQQASEAERAIEATLPSLAEVLATDEVEALRRALPPEASRWLPTDTPRYPTDVDAFYRRMADRSGLEPGFAREQAQSVLAAVGEIADPEAVRRLARHLPATLGDLLEAPHRGMQVPPRSTRTPGATSTLAAGKPGSRHPLAESRPVIGHADSIARSDDPHADTRLSGARGLTQERLEETLAAGRPGPARGLADSRRG